MKNAATCAFLGDMAHEKGDTPAQQAVAWLLSRGDDIVPLVGVSRRGRLAENLAILDIKFSPSELATLEPVFAPGAIVGDRYPEALKGLAAE